MYAVTDTESTLRSYERAVLQPWFDLTGLDGSSPEWCTVWAALVSAGLAGEHGLTLWPAEGDTRSYADTTATQTVRLALLAGAHYGIAFPDVGPGAGAALVLDVLLRYPDMLATALSHSPQDATQQILAILSERVTGIYLDAPSALASHIIAVRSASAEHAATPGEPWEALVDLVLREAVLDDVFAEHVLLEMSNASPKLLDVAVLPDGRWVVLTPAPPTAVAAR